MKHKLASRKLWVAVLGAAVVAFGQQLGLNDHSASEAANVLMAYLGGQSLHDIATSVFAGGSDDTAV